jgi:tetratricopeptide (TPR) repeat protein
VDGMIKLGEIDDAIEALEEVKDRFVSIAGFIFRLAKCQAILGNVEEAKKLVKQAIEKDAKYKMEFAEDSAFDGVWESF